MRPVWPQTRPPCDAVEAISQTRTFFTRRQAQDARYILEQKLLGMDKLETLFNLICPPSPAEPPRTPERMSGSLGDALGVFASLVSLYNRLLKQVAATSTFEQIRPLMDAPKATKVRDAGLAGPVRLSALVPPLDRALADLRLDNQLQEDAGGPGPGPASGHSNPPTLQNLLKKNEGAANKNETLTAIGTRGMGASSSRKATDLCLPPPREPPETVVVDFLVNFIAAIAIQIQPFGRRPVCVADAFEQNFRFGPVPGPVPLNLMGAVVGVEGQQPLQPAASFLARIDGGIPRCRPQVDGGLFAAFEVKRSARELDNVQIRAQETMEHCAIIWERHYKELVSCLSVLHP